MVDKHAMNQLQCAADVQLLLASLTLIASAGTGVGDTCKAPPAPTPAPPRRMEGMDLPELKHLMGENATSLRRDLHDIVPPVRKTGKARNAEIAECVFDTAQIVLLFSRAGLFINFAVKDCVP